MKKFINNILDRLGEGWLAIIFIIGFVAVIAGLAIGVGYLDDNKIDVYASTHYWSDEGDKMDNAITVIGEIYYGGHPIREVFRTVEFCDVKATKKDIRAELKVVRKELLRGCKK